MYMKNILLALVAFIIIAGGVYYFVTSSKSDDVTYEKPSPLPDSEMPEPPEEMSPSDTPDEPTEVEAASPVQVIGSSVSGADIKAYHFGAGDRELLLVLGIHGGYSWNTALLGYELIDWLTANPTVVPADVKVTIVPVLNPDGLKRIAGTSDKFTAASIKGTEAEKEAARFNANKVDLNRNFDCKWQPEGTWQNQTVSGGASVFSEPESQALRDYVNKNEPAAVVAWYSSAGGVYASQCGDSTLSATLSLTNRFAAASGYTAHEEYDYYEITGDMVNWFAKNEIPAISVLLTNHTTTELAKNKAGVEAVLNNLSQE